jgi:hypothetical protein
LLVVLVVAMGREQVVAVQEVIEHLLAHQVVVVLLSLPCLLCLEPLIP